jgi:poly-gamma-glutamate capsule biosynthesis protein CapA/YwtB (metallophosphatase superfamily)
MRRRQAILGAAAMGSALFGRDSWPDGSVELWLGGDVQLGDGSVRFEELGWAVDGAVGIVNLEGPVADAAPATDPERVALWNAPRALEGLRAAGVRVAGIANNHALDNGADGPERTALALEAVGVTPAGGSRGPAVREIGRMRVVVSAHDLSTALPDSLAEELTAAAQEGDVLVSTFHVTGPPSYLPRPVLRSAVDLALRAGALVVAAHGSHALGPVERRGRAVIAWGLGNLLFDCDCTSEIDGAILRVTIRPDHVHATIVPIDAGLGGAPARPAHDPALILELFDALGSTALARSARSASF